MPAFSEALLLSPDPAAASGGILSSPIVLMVAIGAIFYFLVLRPQQAEGKAMAALLASLQKGDRVVTATGLHGKVHEARPDTLVIEIAPNVLVTVDRDAVKRKMEPPKSEPVKGA